MPHPHAPKSPTLLLCGPPPGLVMRTIHVALSMLYGGSPGSKRPTIYSMMEMELIVYIGPVPIMFSIGSPMNISSHRMKPSPNALQAELGFRAETAIDGGWTPESSEQQGAGRKAILRTNLFRKVQTLRLRSRSFSGFDSQVDKIKLPKAQPQISKSLEKSKAEENPPLQIVTKRFKSASAMVQAPFNAMPQWTSVSHTSSFTSRLSDCNPSPLSESRNNLVVLPGIAPPKSLTACTSSFADPPIHAGLSLPSFASSTL
ncbi:hypothetical protein EIP91_008669 [Steccherinum ochraceum]|uniref:Uncharacterized protein n=1 Tax=Steccherinum ochraceum TaxID=92696 RepID=A0A4R0RCG7_9APHY|nr:hypothetical protein EIP91_008669 [Steccherinum ochraceum]